MSSGDHTLGGQGAAAVLAPGKTPLKWTFRGGCDGHEWDASPTEKWIYAIALKCDENGNVSFVSGRLSTNDGLMHEHIGDLEQECTTLEEAKAVSEQWHTERYADNDTEFDKWGGNTGIREELETEQWSGQFKCKACGKPITDGYRIQGILHHGCDLECEACAQTGQI